MGNANRQKQIIREIYLNKARQKELCGSTKYTSGSTHCVHIQTILKPLLGLLAYSDCMTLGESLLLPSIPNLELNRMAVKIMMEFSMNGLDQFFRNGDKINKKALLSQRSPRDARYISRS